MIFIKTLIARFTGKELYLVEFGHSFFPRFARKSPDGKTYFIIYGQPIYLDDVNKKSYYHREILRIV